MPLDTDDEALVMLDPLDQAVAVFGADTKIASQSLDGLMVQGVSLEPMGFQDGVEPCLWQNLDGVDGKGGVWMGSVKIQIVDVGMERTAEKDVDQLHSPADTKHGKALVIRGSQKSQLQLVSGGLAHERLVAAVCFGADIDPATDDEPIEIFGHGAFGVDEYGLRFVQAQQKAQKEPGGAASPVRAGDYNSSSSQCFTLSTHNSLMNQNGVS